MAEDPPLLLGVALDGAGWHPGAWREDDARPASLWDGAYWVELAQRADAAGLDFLTLEDGLALQSDRQDRPDGRIDRVRGRLDAVLVACRVAPATRRIGLIPSVTVTHTEPFHASKAVATLDWVSRGRAGVAVQVSTGPEEYRHFGRRPYPADPADLVEEAADYVEVVRRLWDSWEDDAEIRDASTGRFIDRDKLHPVDFRGRFFSVRGPSITPRPPQGQPPVAAVVDAVGAAPWAVAADVWFVTPDGPTGAGRAVEAVRGVAPGLVVADVAVVLGRTTAEAEDRRDRLDRSAGPSAGPRSHVVTATPTGLADLVEEWAVAGVDGVRFHPAALPYDLGLVADEVVPDLRRRGRGGAVDGAATLRSRLGLGRPANRYSVGRVGA